MSINVYMWEILFEKIEAMSALQLSADDKEHIRSGFKFRKMLKRQYLLQEGDICRYLGFIISGSCRMYTIDDNGHEHILRLGVDGYWLGDYESFYGLAPSRYHIEMLEDTQLLLLTKTDLLELSSKVPAVDQLIKNLNIKCVITTQNRIHASISLNAAGKYNDLVKTHPVFLKRFPQTMIASYLGISAETLTRIRRNN
jgi:CRP-like cAMP-binding protein